MSEELPQIKSIWRHTKSGGEYMVIAHCLIEATLTPAVIYTGGKGYVRDGTLWRTWCRPLSEFMDGRFVLVGS